MKLHPSTYCVLHFTPGARLRSARDAFWPLFWCAVGVLVGLICFLLHLEAMYREDARSVKAQPLSVEGSKTRFATEYGARVLSVRDGQPVIEL